MKKSIFLFVILFLAGFGLLNAQKRGIDAKSCAPATNLKVVYSSTCSKADLSWDAPSGKSFILTDLTKENTPPVSRGMVSVTLEAHDLWTDGTGYQLLLDATHTLYGNTIPSSGVSIYGSCNPPATLYDGFSHKIPVNADPSCTTTNIVFDGSVTIEIPAGIYDWCIVNPTPGDKLYIAGSHSSIPAENVGRRNDYVFQEGYKYHFLMSRFGLSGGVEYGDGVMITAEEDGGDCESVSNLSVVVSGNKVDLSWNAAPGNPTAYQVIRNGNILTTLNINTTSYTDNNAPEGFHNYCIKTIYSDCFKSVCKSVNVGDKCALRFELFDEWGDGWQGASIGIKVDGASYGTVTLPSGSSGKEIKTIPSGVLELSWNKGSWDYDCSFEVYDKEDILIYYCAPLGAYSLSGTFFTYNNDCSKPATRYNVYRDGNLLAENIYVSSYSDMDFNLEVPHIWSVTVVCDGEESQPVEVAKCACTGAINECDELIFGPGTSNINSLPFSVAYNYGYSQQIFHASEFEDFPDNSKITSIAYHWIYNTPATYSNVTIYMGNTPKDTFANTSDWIPHSQLQQVYSGSVSVSNVETWSSIILDMPFDYAGGNVVVAVMNNTGATYFDLYTATWRYHSPELGPVTLFYRNSTGPINPYALPTAFNRTSSRSDTKFEICATYITHEIAVSANIPGAGTVTGTGTYKKDECVAVYAKPAQGNSFIKWTKNGTEVSKDALYTFLATEDMTLVAHFKIEEGIFDMKKMVDFTIYPNPAKNLLNIVRPTAGVVQIEIYNSIGTLVQWLEMNEVGTSINLSAFASGVYLIRLTDGQNSSIQRFVKE